MGDVVAASVEEKRTFVLSGPNIPVPSDMSASAAAAVTAGNSMNAVSGSKTINTWWVTAVDPAAGKISLVDPGGGRVRTFNVTDPAALAQLSRVKPGDSLTSINSTSAVMSLTPKG